MLKKEQERNIKKEQERNIKKEKERNIRLPLEHTKNCSVAEVLYHLDQDTLAKSL